MFKSVLLSSVVAFSMATTAASASDVTISGAFSQYNWQQDVADQVEGYSLEATSDYGIFGTRCVDTIIGAGVAWHHLTQKDTRAQDVLAAQGRLGVQLGGMLGGKVKAFGKYEAAIGKMQNDNIEFVSGRSLMDKGAEATRTTANLEYHLGPVMLGVEAGKAKFGSKEVDVRAARVGFTLPF